MQSTTGNGLRLISFDGGGARVLSQLKIMETAMHRIQYDRYPDDPDKIVLPCECFDMMGGSDMGGTIAIMFSKLRMSVEDVMYECHRICSNVYVDVISPEERSRRLRQSIEDLLERRGLPSDLKLGKDSRLSEEGCPCFVVATLKNSMNSKVKLRTYRTRTEPASSITVVEAVLATCAMQPTFTPISVGPVLSRQELVGGAMGTGNPCRELVLEAFDKFKGGSQIAVILSLGVGHPGTMSAPDEGQNGKWNDVLRAMLTNCEEIAQSTEIQMGHLGVYFRFSVDQGLQRHHEDSVNDAGWVMSQTQAYLLDAQVSRRLDQCTESLLSRQGLATLEQLRHTGSQPIYKDVPTLTSYFVMREEPWNKMMRLLDQNGGSRRQRVLVISGMAGSGKTQLLIHFTNEFGSRFRHVFFVDASSKESIQADLINHVRTTSPAYSQATFADALSFFSNARNLPWLITYDNCDDVELDLQSLLPSCSHGSIILTTRNRSRGPFASPPELHLELDVMSDEEAVDVIMKSAGLQDSEENRQSAALIAEELGNLPVALVQAGSYIFQTQCSCVEYLNRLRNFKSDMMQYPTADREHRSAYAAFELTYRQLPAYVQRFLHLLGCFHFANFPMGAISIAAQAEFRSVSFAYEDHGKDFEAAVQTLTSTFAAEREWDERTLDSLVHTLQNYSLASFVRSSPSLLLQMHPLLHSWLSSHFPLEEQIMYQLAACRLVACLLGAEYLHRYLIYHIVALRTHLIDRRIPVNDLAVLGAVLGKMGHTKDSELIQQQIYDLTIKIYGSKNLRTATAATELARVIHVLDLGKTEQLLTQAFEIRKIKLGMDHLDTLKAEKSLAATYTAQRRYTEAESLLTDAMGREKGRFGPNHPESINSMLILARIYRFQYRNLEAKTLQEQVLKLRKQSLGDTHLDTIWAMDFLASTYHWLGRYSDAQRLREQVLNIRKERLGDNHSHTILAMSDLASTHCALGRYSDAQKLQEDVVNVRKEQSGDSHRDTLSAMHNLCSTYRSQGRLYDAKQLQEQVLEVRKGQLGDTHPDTLDAMHELALTYYSLRFYPNARELQERLLEKRRLGDNHLHNATSMHNLACTYCSLGQFTQARQLAMEAEGVKKQYFAINHPHYQATVKLLKAIDAAIASLNL